MMRCQIELVQQMGRLFSKRKRKGGKCAYMERRGKKDRLGWLLLLVGTALEVGLGNGGAGGLYRQ